MVTHLWADLGLHAFWRDALADDAGEVSWAKIFALLVANQPAVGPAQRTLRP